MLYQSTSIQEVIGRVIRNTRVQDSSYLLDMNEWIPEAMGYMRTRFDTKYKYEDVQVHFHKAKLPCGLHSLLAVEYCGHRVAYSNRSNLNSSRSRQQHMINATGIFQFVPTQEQLTINGQPILSSYNVSLCTTLSDVNSLSFCNEWYQPEMGYLNTSICDGWIRLHYKEIPLDKGGMPLIPDEENYKEALYWYVRSRMIGAGFKDTVFTYEGCEQRFETHAGRAKAKITYPSTDVMESRMGMVSMIFPDNYWQNYFK